MWRPTALLPFFVVLLAGAPQALAQFNFKKIANAVKAQDPQKVAQAFKDANPSDVMQQIAAKGAEGTEKARAALQPLKDTAAQSLKDTVADAAQAAHAGQPTLPPPPPVPAPVPAEVKPEEVQHYHVKQAIKSTHVKNWADALRGASPADLLHTNPQKVVKAVTESVKEANPEKVKEALTVDAKKVANALQDASPKEVVEEIKAAANGQNATSKIAKAAQERRPMNVVEEAQKKVTDMLKGKSAEETVDAIQNASPQKIAESLPDITPKEAVKKALRPYIPGGEKADEKSDGTKTVSDQDLDTEQPSSVSPALVALLVLAVLIFAGWRTFLFLTRPKRTGLPMLDGELHEGDSVQMMSAGGWLGGGGGAAREMSQPGFTRF